MLSFKHATFIQMRVVYLVLVH